jgi:hypothetical protein
VNLKQKHIDQVGHYNFGINNVNIQGSLEIMDFEWSRWELQFLKFIFIQAYMKKLWIVFGWNYF